MTEPRVLVVGDGDDSAAAAIADAIAHPTTVASPSDAIERVDFGSLSCVVARYDAASGEGSLAERLRRDGSAVPVVTFATPDDDVEAAVEAGATHVVSPDDGTDLRLVANAVEDAAAAGVPGRERIQQLQAVATEMIGADSVADVASMTVEAAAGILDLDMCVFDEVSDGTIRPVAVSSGMPDDGYDADRLDDDSVAGLTYNEERSWLIDDVREVPQADPESDAFRAAISVPIGGFGVFQAVAEEPGAFDETDLELTEILVSHAFETIERIESELELAESERFLSTMISNLPGMVYRCVNEPEWPMDFVSDGCEELTGYRAGRFEDGDLVWGEDVIHDEDAADVWNEVQAAIEDDEPFELTYRIVRSDGEVRWVRERGRMIDGGDAPALEGLIVDVTERKKREAELRRQKERLDEFARIVSHDLRNPLSVARGHVEMLDEEFDRESIDHVADALDRMDEIVGSVLTLAGTDRPIEERERIDLASVVRTAWSNVQTDGMSLDVTGSMAVRGDRALLRQLFENLVRNAREHAGTAATVRVGASDGGFYVEDDGPGVPEDRRDEVFELGTSDGDGTGTGLAIVERVADAHGWAVRIEESEAGGARFAFSTGDDA